MVARARDGVLYYTSWYTNISLSRLYSTVTEGIQIFQVMGPAFFVSSTWRRRVEVGLSAER